MRKRSVEPPHTIGLLGFDQFIEPRLNMRGMCLAPASAIKPEQKFPSVLKEAGL